jgi:putative membrane protein
MKKSIALALTLPALALLASCGHKADVDTNTTLNDNGTTTTEISSETDNGVMNAEVPTPAMTGQAFANAAASTDAYEIAAGKLAETKATSQALKDFGKMMVSNHTDSTANLKKAAAKASPAVTPDASLTAEQRANLATLQSATGEDFDTAYKSQQIATHQTALAAMQGYAASGDVEPLKDFASSTSKVVKTHLEKIQGM